MVSSATTPWRAPMPPTTPRPFELPSTWLSMSKRSLPSVSITSRGARSR